MKRRPANRFRADRPRMVVTAKRASLLTPDLYASNFLATPIQDLKLTGRWRDIRLASPTPWYSGQTFGPSDRRALTGTTVGTTVQYRGANLTPYGARGVWTSWSGASSVGATYQLKAGNGPVIATNFVTYSTSLVDYLVGKGMNFFRILINHEAAQPDPTALAIPYAGAFTNASRYSTYWAAVKALVDYCVLTKGATVVLDLHNAENEMVNYYNQRFRQSPGAGEVNSSILVDFWTRMATIFDLATYGGKVWFGIHNEPNQGDGASISNWFPIVQDVINGIRSTGNTGKILVPGLDFTSSMSFIYNGSYAAFRALTDSANNLAIQVHFYFDSTNSGGGTSGLGGNPDFGMTFGVNTSFEPKDRKDDGTIASAATDIGPARFRGLLERCREDGVEVYATEVGFSTKTTANADQTVAATAAWRAFQDFCNTFADVMKGWCWWQSSGIPGHLTAFDQVSGVDSPMMDVVETDFVSRIATPIAPASFTSPLSLASTTNWWRPSNGGVGNGSNIVTLTDSGPANKSLTSPATGLTYISADTDFNSTPSMSTAATANKRLQHNALVVSAEPWWFALAIFKATSSATEFWWTNAGNYDNSCGFTIQTDTFGRWRTKTTAGATIGGASAAAFANGGHVVLGVMDGTNSLVYRGDHSTPVASGTVDTGFALSVITIGSFGTAMTMKYGEICCGSGRLTSKQRRDVMRYLGTLSGFSTS